MSYRQKLLDPRWQRRRLEILSRDTFTCQCCGDASSTLHVHHRWYNGGQDPWEASDDALVTLCATCHEEGGDRREEAESFLLSVARKHLLAKQVDDLVWEIRAKFGGHP